ncbi:MAG: putative baseplate assembly protein [Candidatus Sulfotelmatobacter sp.]
MSCSGGAGCLCGCCAGISVETPQGESNLPGLPAIAYRTGTWWSFKESMLARLSSSQYPALAGLKTRDDDDLSIAFLDATSVVLDILTFYQERLANESYLRTATQLYSLTQLSRLIGYQPSPGVGASTYVAFTLRAATGLPANPNTPAITIPAGTQVQSVPAQGQTPQAFQTSADILAKPDWNALPVQTGVPWAPASSGNLYPSAGQTSLYVAGTSTQLNPGDAILIVGDERLNDPDSTVWDLCHIVSVQPDTVNQRTLITWLEPLGANADAPSQVNPQVYALRQRASLFGYNALNPLMLTTTAMDNLGDLVVNNDWNFGTAANSYPAVPTESSLIDLDSVYAKIAAGGWMVLYATISIVIDEPGFYEVFIEPYINLYNLTAVTTVARSDYGMSAKITRATADVTSSADLATLGTYFTDATRSTAVLAQSELLPVAEQPLDHPLYGTLVDLEVLRPDLVGVSAIAITGKNPKLTVNAPDLTPSRPVVYFYPNDAPTTWIALTQGQVLTLLQPPNSIIYTPAPGTTGVLEAGSIPDWSGSGTGAATNLTPPLVVADASGRVGTINPAPPPSGAPPATPLGYFTLTSAGTNDPVVQEYALVANVTLETDSGFPHTQIQLTLPLQNVYDRTSTKVNANVAAATAGSPVTELLGSGSAATTNQQFQLKQSPLTYVSAPTQSGSQSSLTVSANGAKWTGVPTLYDQAPTAQVYTTLNLPGGIAQVTFGDGVEGATLPTGTNNIQASYRVGIGSAGNVAAGAITTLVDRPVGVSGVTNPQAATGGQDAQSVDDIRTNAPLSVLTLGRAVSLADYQNFAATYPGIVKAAAMWVPSGPYRGIWLTVAASGGTQLLPTDQTWSNLIASLESYGSPNVAVNVQSFYETTFGFSANILYDPAYSQPAVEAAVMTLLQTTYSFANQTFGQGVYADEIAALIQGVTGVIAVNVSPPKVVATSQAGDIGSAAFSVAAYYAWSLQAISPPLQRPCTTANNGICPFVPVASLTAPPSPAEILVLDPNPINVVLGTMS